MNKFGTGVATAVVLTGLAGTAVAADAAAAQSKQHVIRLRASQLESHETTPNHFVGAERLRSPRTHKIVGYDSFFGVVNPKTNRLRNWQAFALQGGLINWFLSTTTARATGPITGGSGKFKGVKGSITVIPKRNLYIVRYHF
jgi:hypothetical protein